MHTFFVNTSQKKFNEYDVLFDIHYEKMSLVSMDCSIGDWYDRDKGYHACVKRMSDMIDGYVAIDNAFDLIIYIDLPENEAYSSIPRGAFNDKAREECCRAMHILFMHIVSESIVKELVDSGRKPQNVLIMFGEEKKFTGSGIAASTPDEEAVRRKLFDFIGLPDTRMIEQIAGSIAESDTETAELSFGKEIQKIFGQELLPGIRNGWHIDLQLWYKEIISYSDVEKANISLFKRISDTFHAESNRMDIKIISCPYDCYACRVNKSSLTLSQLNIALFLLKCVENKSIYWKNEDTGSMELIPFHLYSVDEIAPILKAKELQYSKKVVEIESISKSYAELRLAPQLSSFDHNKFGLDAYGAQATELVVSDVQSARNGHEVSQGGNAPDDLAMKGRSKKVSAVKKSGRVLFTSEEYQPFDYKYDHNGEQMLKKNATAEQYVEQAKNVRKHHMEYLHKLKMHISDVLSHYAGKSKENKPALLQIGSDRYSDHNQEKKSLELVEDVSKKAYDTMLDQYMAFCAGRSVAVTDIEEQCDWFVSRVSQIKESLRKIKFVALGSLIAIIVLYIPFFVIQFGSIVENVLTFTVAMLSLLIPVIILYMVFAFISSRQRKKYIEAWKIFKEKSDQALQENAVAAQKYDQLLSVVIPALRWVYEYKLDVDFCAECCSVADAKIEHHMRILRDRISAIQNILSDLEYHDFDEENLQGLSCEGNTIDYTVSFCTGTDNRTFYSIIGRDLLKAPN